MWRRGLAFLLRWRLGVSFALDCSQWHCRNTVVETYSCGWSHDLHTKIRIFHQGFYQGCSTIGRSSLHPRAEWVKKSSIQNSGALPLHLVSISTVRAQYNVPIGPQCQRRKRGRGSSLGCLLKRHVVVADACTSTFSLHFLKRRCFRPRIRDRISPLLAL